MLTKVFQHGIPHQLGTVWRTGPPSARRLTWSAYASQALKNEIYPRRTQHPKDREGSAVHPSVDATRLRSARPYDWHSGRPPRPGDSSLMHRAMIAFGSNLGDRVSHIERALQEMGRRQLNVSSVSGLYETEPMYVKDQDSFLNGACEVWTHLEPLPLLDVLQGIENDLGRERIIDKGPRNIDLDILLYDSDEFLHDRLQIPHKLMLEREFVLRPLADLIPEEHLPVPLTSQAVNYHLKTVEQKAPDGRPDRVTAMSPRLPLLKSTNPTRSTHLMAILNLTPDSFSDGNIHSSTNMDELEKTVQHFIKSGATIIDIGGQSTRPNAEKVSPAHELERILPAIRQIRSMPEANNTAISVDTFYASVAEEAVSAGANIINDVTAGQADPLMLATAARLQKTIILMHMRGTPKTMTKLTHYPGGIINGVGIGLSDRVKAAKAAGIRPWRIILDPGIGFAKTQDQNLELLRRLGDLRTFKGLEGYPWLVGTSRKGFIGTITEVKNASDRAWGTAAAVTASIKGGAEIVRVHDMAEMAQVTKMADAIFRVEDREETAQESSPQAFKPSTPFEAD